MKDRYLFKKILIFFITFSVLLESVQMSSVVKSIETGDDVTFYSDDKGNFLYTGENGSLSRVYIMSSNGRTTVVYEDALKADYVYRTNNTTYIVTNTTGNTLVGRIRGGIMRSAFLDGISVKKNCFVADDMGIIYAVDKNHPKYVRVFDSDGYDMNKYNAFGNIIMLFHDKSSNDVFAVSNNGVFNITAGFIKISSVVPDGEFIINERLCTDSAGNVFEFDPLAGFNKILDLDYDMLCPTNESVYGVVERTVYRLDNNGDKISYINLSVKPERLLSSKKNLAYIFNNKITIIKTSDMKEIQKTDESSISPVSEPVVSQPAEESTHEISKSDVEADKNYGISSDYLEISNGFIFLEHTMTLAELKKSIKYNDNELIVKNHNGKAVTSGNVGSNWQITFSGKTEKTFCTVLPGDITGEGNVNSRDIKSLSDYLINDTGLSPPFLYAADTDEDGVISLIDLYKIYKSC